MFPISNNDETASIPDTAKRPRDQTQVSKPKHKPSLRNPPRRRGPRAAKNPKHKNQNNIPKVFPGEGDDHADDISENSYVPPPPSPHSREEKWSRISPASSLTDKHDSTVQSLHKLSKLSNLGADLMNKQNDPFYRTAFGYLETIALGCVAIARAPTTEAAVFHFTQMTHSFMGGSVGYSIFEMFSAVELSGAQGENDPEWITALQLMIDDWESFKTSPLVPVASKLLTILVSMMYCKVESVNFNLLGLELFSKDIKVKDLCWDDLYSVVIDLLKIATNQGYQAFKLQSLRPLLFEDDKLSPMLERITECEKFARYYSQGNLQMLAAMDEQALDKVFKMTIEDVKSLIKMTRSAGSKRVLQDKLHRLTLVYSSFVERLSQGGLKFSPFVIGFWGGSSVGKSSLAAISMSTILRSMGVSYLDSDIATFNGSDSFMSSLKNSITGLMMDEVGQMKEGYVQNPDVIPFMQFANNARFYANMPSLEDKGKICPAPYCLITTKNVKDNGARCFVNEPLAVVRREHFIVTVTVKEEFSTNGMLDTKKVQAHYGKLVLIPNIWDLKVECVQALPGTSNTENTNVLKTDFRYVVYERETPSGEKISYAKVDIEEFLDLLVIEAKEHYIAQRQIVEACSEVGSRLPFCDDHKCFLKHCGPECQVSSEVTPSLAETIDSPSVSTISLASELQTGVPKLPFWRRWFASSPASMQKEESSLTSWDEFDAHALASLTKIHESSSFLQALDLKKFPLGRRKVETTANATKWYEVSDNPNAPQMFRRPEWRSSIAAWSFDMVKPFMLSSTGHMFDQIAGNLFGYLEDDLDDTCRFMRKNSLFSWHSWLPDDWLEYGIVRDLAVSCYSTNKADQWIAYMVIVFFMQRLWVNSPVSLFWTLFAELVICHYLYDTAYAWGRKLTHWRMIRKHGNVPSIVKTIRSEMAGPATKIALLIAALEILRQAHNCFREVVPVDDLKTLRLATTEDIKPDPCTSVQFFNVRTKEHGSFVPTNNEDIKTKNAAGPLMEQIAREHNWVKPFVQQLPCTEKSLTITSSDLARIVNKNVLIMKTTDPFNGLVGRFQVLMIGHNVGLTTHHALPDRDQKVEFLKESGKSSANFSCWLGPRSIEKIEGTDLALFTVPNGGTWKNLIDYFPDAVCARSCGYITYNDLNTQERHIRKVKFQSELVTTTNLGGEVDAFEYESDFTPFSGLCGAPLIAEGRESVIVGIHQSGTLGAIDNTGYAAVIDRGILQQTLAQLSGRWFLPLHSGTMVTKFYGNEILENLVPHSKSPVHTQENGHFEFIGSTIGRTKFNSSVHLLPSSRLIEEKFETTCTFRSPSRDADHFKVALSFMVNPSDGIEPEFLSWASEDYQEQLEQLFYDLPDLVAEMRPLTDMEAIRGIDGVRFIDSINMTTSPGIPSVGTKHDFFDWIDDVPIPKPILVAEMQRIEACWEKGERCYTIFKTCLKDEPTEKEIARAFNCGQLAFTLLCRKYTAFLIRTLQMSLNHSECCVGINPHGTDWDDWQKWHTEYSSERIFDGDYSKYDLRQSAAVSGVTAHVFQELARLSPLYTSRDILMIRGIFTEIMYPVISVNGDLIQFYGLTPSGVSVTVVKNSVDNSIILRSAAKKLNPNLVTFRDAAKIGTYGDDCRGGVHKDHTYFCGPNVSRILEDWDYVFTPSDKGGEWTQWNPDGDFLKMRSHIVEGTEIEIGALMKKSILKPLMVGTKSCLTPLQQVSTNIDGALRDSFAHGREYYEFMRSKLCEVADELDILVWCSELQISYDDALIRWKERYLDEDSAPT